METQIQRLYNAGAVTTVVQGPSSTMNENLIYDVGMHEGNDSEFYLKKGFSVVAIEADPDLAAKAEKRLKKYIDNGKLTILNVAIGEFVGESDFYRSRDHDDWGTLSSDFVQRNSEIYGSSGHDTIKVNCTRFENILTEQGIPYYLKVDIEGFDILCLQALLPAPDRPRYISIEPSQTDFEEAFTELSLLWQLGYRQFKIVNQALNGSVRCPNPPLEGKYANHNFGAASSGPFGEEAPGEWLTIEETIERYRKTLKLQSLFGTQAGWHGKYHGTLLQKAFNFTRRLSNSEPLGWYDLHCKRDNAHDGAPTR